MTRVFKRDRFGWRLDYASEPTLVAAADAPTGVVVVATPADFDHVGDTLIDEPHVTLGYYGDATEISDDVLNALRAWVAEIGEIDVMARVSGVARMGNDDPQAVALLLEAEELNELRTTLEAVAQVGGDHPHFTPHLTIGYGIEMPNETPNEVRLNQVQLWIAGEHYTGTEDDDAVEQG